jgi:hypothetical protein
LLHRAQGVAHTPPRAVHGANRTEEITVLTNIAKLAAASGLALSNGSKFQLTFGR